MTDESFKIDLKEVKLDLQRAIVECSQRGLLHSTKWLSEMNFALREVKLDSPCIYTQSFVYQNETEHYLVAKSYLDLKEYDRCAHFTEFCKVPLTRFLHFYSRYLSGEKKKIDDMIDITTPSDPTQSANLQELGTEFMRDYVAEKLDGYELYLYGVVLKRIDFLWRARKVLVEAICKEPMHWGSWLELSTLITDRTENNSIEDAVLKISRLVNVVISSQAIGRLKSLKLPDHWMKHFFLGHTFLELQLNEDALDIYFALQHKGFEKSTYLIAQTAIAFHNRRDVDAAITTFRRLQKCDPFRLDNLDTYSNLLYVKELRVELAHLAHQACEIDKYRVETCCVVGNYYSLRSEHQKAVMYFQRALKLNPQYLSAWTLMGHEFMEMKNTNAAIQSYRQAIEVNRRDYRAWYGLGQTYEILKMLFYCLYYYKQAQQLRPNDSRMLIALGETYERLDKIRDAQKCYYKARNVGDIEGTALLKLAKLYDKLNETSFAAASFLEYVSENESRGDKSELSQSYKYLANFFLKRNQLDKAYQYAQKCLEYDESKEEGKALLRSIAQKRSLQEEGEMQVEEDSASIIRVRPRLAEGSPNSQLTPLNLSFTN